MKLQLIVAIIFIAFSSFVFADSHLGDDTILPIRPVGYGNKSDSGSFALSASIADYSPKWSWLDLENTSDDANKNWITISGCGFKQFAEAVCVFDFKFTSTYSYIHDDNTIYCELPTKSVNDFDTLPQVSRLDVVFDGELSTFDSSNSNNGNRVLYVGPFRWGPQIECDDPISPLRGDTSGETITVHGQGFADAALSELKVWVDDQECTGSSVQSDTAITCSAPPAVVGGFREINKYSVVSVTWGADTYWSRTSNGTAPECYLHANRMYKYGPEVEDIFPACTSVYGEGAVGNRELTIRGSGFLDSAFNVDPASPDGSNYNNQYLIEVTVENDELPENPFVLQARGQATENGIRFAPPNFFEYTDESEIDWQNFFGATATVVVYYRQLNRWYSIDTNESPLSFTYGPIIESFTFDDDSKITALHAGGEDSVCFHGCGFSNYTNDHIKVEFASGNSNFCTADGIQGSGDSQFCCETVAHQCGPTDIDVIFYFPENDDLTTDVTISDVLGDDDVYVGPIVDAVSPSRYRVTPIEDMEVSGTSLMFTADCSDTTSGCWSEFPLVDKMEAIADKSYHCSDPNQPTTCSIESGSIGDSEMNYNLPLAEFDASFTPEFTFDRPDSGLGTSCSSHANKISFGPTCEDVIRSTAIFGDESVTVQGTFFGNYETHVRLCRISATNCDDLDEYENVTSTVRTAESISLLTENWKTDAEEEFNRGRRYWGQQFDVLIWFNSAADGLVAPTSGYDYTFDECEDCDGCTGSCDTFARKSCGKVRFGPTITSIEPCKGPISGSTGVELFATDAADQWAQPRDDDALSSHNLVIFGTLFGSVGTQSESSVSTTTVWGATANTDDGVSVIFDTCNITSAVTEDGSDDEITVAWGPDLYFQSKGDDAWALSFGASTNFWRDTETTSETYGFWWGLPAYADAGYPADGDDILTINGHGFDEFSHFAASVDGVLVSATLVSETIRVEVPVRPFGTIAKVCVHFGSLKCNNHGSVFTGDLESNYKYKICSEEYLVYQPYVGGLSATNFRTSGYAAVDGDGDLSNDINNIATTVLELRADSYFEKDGFEIFVGQYKADVTDHTPTAVTFRVPTFSAEFNSYASVRVEWKTPVRLTNDEDEWHGCDEDNNRHWGAVASEMIHFGPLCSGAHTSEANWLLGTEQKGDGIHLLSDSYPTVGRHLAKNIVVTLATQFLMDCTFDYENDQECPDDTNLNDCSHPQRSTQLQNIQTDDDSGIFKRCLHRNVEVRISDFGSENPFGGDSVDYSVAGNDDIFVVANKTDTQIKAFVKARDDDIDCTFITFGLYFPDALVTSDDQRWIECTDAQGDIWKHYYGPTVQIFEENNDNNAVWWRSNDDFAELSKVYRGGASDADLPFFYGWGYESMTSSVRKEAEGGAENSVNVDIKTGGDDDFFEYDLNGDERTGNYLVPYLSNNHPDVSVENLHSTSIDWFAPAGDDDDFGEIVSVKLFWALQSSTSGRICERTVFHFHYGPILTGSTRDGCIDPVPLREAGGESTTDSRVTIKGRAFTCCGFEDITTGPSDLDGMTGCYFQTNSNNRATRNTYVRANGATEQFDDGLSEIVCSIPESDSPEFRLAGFGLCFNCTNADEYCGPDDGSICDGDADADGFLLTRTDTDTDSEGYMDICYGPKLSDSTDLPRVRMSGLEDPNNLPGCVTDNLVTGPDFYEYYENAKVVTLDYQGVAEGSPNSLLHQNKANITFCAQCSFDPSWSNQVITTSCERYDSNVDCKVPVFLHQCGDGPDEVFVEWLFTADGEARSYIQKDFDYPPTISGTRWLEEGVDRVDEYLYYGPTASVKLNEHGDDHGLMVNRKQFRLPTTAASFDPITVVLENFEDWHCDSLNSDVSPARTKSVMCIVENNDGYLYRSLDDNENANSVNVVSFNTQSFYQIDSSGEIECHFGNGYFGAEGKLRILLDPHVDQWTVLSATDDDWNPVGDGSYWHWHASSSMLSKTWGGPSGLEPITFYGAGFCEYSHVKCIFDQAGERSSYAVQGDIIGDGMVVCQSPPNHAPQEGTLSISFCGSDDGDVLDAAYTNGTLPCDCNFGHCETADEISLGFTFVGADAVHPRHGPVFGNTTVYFSNVGLEDNAYYDRIECVFHIDGREEVVLATSTDMDLNVTVSPPAGTFSCVTPPVENGRQHALVEIRGYYNTFENQVGGYLFDANLGCFWFDYGYPTVRSVTPSTTVFGSSDDVIVVSGDYFNGGTSTGDYLCYWQHGALPSSDLPDELGQDPTFSTGRVYVTEGLLVNVAGNWDGQDFNDFEIHCIAPNFEQIGAYPFDVSFQSSEVTSQLYGSPVWRYDVTPGAATIEFVETDHFDDDDDNSTPIEPDDYYMDELGGIITLHGTGFAGGRLESDDHTYGYVCTFEASLNGTDVVRHTIALSDVSNTEVVCVAPYFELSDNDLDFTEVAVSLSVDTGYSLQASASLEYRSNSDLIECLEDGAAQSLVFASFFLLLSAFILHFLF